MAQYLNQQGGAVRPVYPDPAVVDTGVVIVEPDEDEPDVGEIPIIDSEDPDVDVPDTDPDVPVTDSEEPVEDDTPAPIEDSWTSGGGS